MALTSRSRRGVGNEGRRGLDRREPLRMGVRTRSKGMRPGLARFAKPSVAGDRGPVACEKCCRRKTFVMSREQPADGRTLTGGTLRVRRSEGDAVDLHE